MNEEKLKAKLVQFYEDMYQLTKPECGQCRAPYSCCSAEYCIMARDHAKDAWGEDLPQIGKYPYGGRVPYLVNGRCIVPPHLRPACTLHTCDINSLGGKKGDWAWSLRYFKLRDKIDKAEYLKHELDRTRTKGIAQRV